MTTERVLPAVALPSPGLPRTHGERPTRPAAGPRPSGAAHPAERTARPTVRRAGGQKEAILSTPIRAGMLIGASAAIYAVSLAAVSTLQYRSEMDLAAHNQPMLDTIARARAANDALQASVVAAGTRTQAVAAEYGAAGKDIAAYQAQLDSLAQLVAKVQGSAAALSTKISLPSVSIHGSVGGSGSAPATTATTSASAKP